MPDQEKHHSLTNPFSHSHDKQPSHHVLWNDISRDPGRPHTLDLITGFGGSRIFTDFVELHGDRLFGDDPAIIGGLAAFEGQTVMIIGQQKGKNTKENTVRNFGMPKAEGYRKAERLMKHADKFGFPIIAFIDTPGASPSIEAEERGIGQAIAQNILTMMKIKVPIVAVILGEGSSGGALGIGVADRLLMLENSIYTVASPEAVATILFRDATLASEAAKTLRIRAHDIKEFGIADEVIPEPPGGAQKDFPATSAAIQEAVSRHLKELKDFIAQNGAEGPELLMRARREKFRSYGVFEERKSEELASISDEADISSMPAENEEQKTEKI